MSGNDCEYCTKGKRVTTYSYTGGYAEISGCELSIHLPCDYWMNADAEFEINYCPMCGRKTKKGEHNNGTR